VTTLASVEALEPLERLEALLADVNAVSFDLFDTLVGRHQLFSPRDLFLRVREEAEARLGRRLEDFTTLRVRAEETARVRAWGRGEREITLDEIYVELARVCGLGPAETSKFAAIELECERQAIGALAAGRALFDRAHASGKPVAIVTDTYLPHDFVEELITREGFRPDKTFVSSAYRRTKFDGSLYTAVLAELGCAPGRLLHVGNSRPSDVGAALAAGAKVLHVETPRQRWKERLGLGDGGCGSRAMSALLCRMADDPDGSMNDRAPAAYSAAACAAHVAPLYLGFASWLVQEIRRRGCRRVFFAAREGAILKRVFDAVARAAGLAADSHYLRISRAALYPTLVITDPAGARRLFSRSWDRLPIAAALGRMSLSVDACRDLLVEHGIARPDRAMKGSLKQRFDRFLDDAWPLVEQANAEKHALATLYLQAQGVLTGERAAFVDIGWNGSLQHCIERLCAHLGVRKELHGLYLSTIERPPGAPLNFRADGYLLNEGEPAAIAPLVRAAPTLIELLCAADHGVVCGYRREGESVVPVLEDAAWERKQFHDVIEPIQTRALALVEDALASAGGAHATFEAPDPALVARAGLRVVYAPTAAEAAVLGRLEVVTDFGGPVKSLTGAVEWDLDDIAGEILPDGHTPMWRAGYYALKRTRASSPDNGRPPSSARRQSNPPRLQRVII
jgi:FMN phosphatase YigB (HAD superfamily)